MPKAVPVAAIDMLESVSVKLAPVSATAFVLVSVSVTVDVPKAEMVAGLKAFAMVAGASTVIQAPEPAAPADPPPKATSAIAAVIFVVAPICALPFVLAALGQVAAVGVADVVMLTVIVQLVWPAVIVRFAIAILPAPAVAVTLPPVHVPPTTEGVATTSPAGRLSVKLKVCVGFPAG